MEKPTAKPKNNILKYLPKAASAIYFQNPPFSPTRDRRSDNYFHRVKHHGRKGFSGPILSIIPDEVQRKTKHGSASSFETQEPTSPKISCIGQIKHKKKMMSKTHKHTSPPRNQQETKPASTPQIKKHTSAIKKLFSSSRSDEGRRRSDASVYDKHPLTDRAHSLCQMKRFASGRDTFANFDWSAQITPVESDHQNYYSDDDKEEEEEEEGIHSDQEEEEEVNIPFSGPIIVGPVGSLQPKKEVNLWKRRTINPPKPLRLNLMD